MFSLVLAASCLGVMPTIWGPGVFFVHAFGRLKLKRLGLDESEGLTLAARAAAEGATTQQGATQAVAEAVTQDATTQQGGTAQAVTEGETRQGVGATAEETGKEHRQQPRRKTALLQRLREARVVATGPSLNLAGEPIDFSMRGKPGPCGNKPDYYDELEYYPDFVPEGQETCECPQNRKGRSGRKDDDQSCAWTNAPDAVKQQHSQNLGKKSVLCDHDPFGLSGPCGR